MPEPTKTPQERSQGTWAGASTIILVALALATVIDLIALAPSLTASPDEAEPFVSLSPRDFLAAASVTTHRGLFAQGSPYPIVTSEEDLTWLPTRDEPTVEKIDSTWRRVSFPFSKDIPSLRDATISVAPTKQLDKERPCRRVAQESFSCDAASWASVEEREVTVLGEQTRCIWAHPLANKTTTITFKDFPARDKETELFIEIAFHDQVTRDSLNPVAIDLAHHQEAATYRAKNTRKGWQSFPVPLGETSHDLELSIGSTKPGRHQLCYRFVRRARAEESSKR